MSILRQESAERLRRGASIAGCSGAAAIVFVAVGDGIGVSGVVADVALAMVAVSLCAGWLSLRWNLEPDPVGVEVDRTLRSAPASYITPVAIAAIAAITASSWFRSGSALARGDIPPPQGLAWIGHIFAPWSGTDLGGPNGLATQLPWAAVLDVVHSAGGSAPLAQRLWLTGLFAGIGIGGYLFLRVLDLTPLAAGAGALVYLFNPYTVSMVGINTVFLTAMALLPLLAAIMLGAVTARIPIGWAAVLMASTAPLIGYAYANPPLVLLLAGGTIFAAGYGVAVSGPAARGRLIRFGLLGLPLVAASCAYWAVPMLIQSGTVASTLSHTSGWNWTEARATLANGFWLNTTWGWLYPAYYPFAASYSAFPIAVTKYLLPGAAFAALPVSFFRGGSHRLRRLAIGGAAAALLLIFVSTGTRAPGNTIFNLLYNLPYGWLLQEPGRFLMGAALAYSVLVGVSAQRITDIVSKCGRDGESRRPGWLIPARPVQAFGLAAIALVVLISPGYPLAFGQIVPDGAHVVLPRYWSQMASFINSSPIRGSALVLPSDDFYQMPYTWGYYGNDGFITQLLSRPVIDPTGQGYETTSVQLLTTVQQISADLANGDWSSAQPLLDAIEVRMVLVRGDVEASFPGRNIVSPAAITVGLRHDPRALLAHQDGPLSLYTLTAPTPGPLFTVNSVQPNLNVLRYLPRGARLVSGRPRRGVSAVVQAPPVASWRLNGNSISTPLAISPGSRYRLIAIQPWSAGSSSRLLDKNAGSGQWRLKVRGRTAIISGQLGTNEVVDGSLRTGLWQPVVGDCNKIGHRRAPSLSAKLIPGFAPGGRTAMRLQAAADSACEATRVLYAGGPLLLSALIDNVRGAPASMCLWEQGLNRCATLVSPIPSGHGWKRYQTQVTVDPGARSLALFVYAPAPNSPGRSTTTYYADVSIHRAPSDPVLITRSPRDISARTLRVAPIAFGSYWIGPAGDHVRVDGLLDGWLGTPTQVDTPVRYRYATAVRLSQYLSLAVGGSTILLAVSMCGRRLARRRRA